MTQTVAAKSKSEISESSIKPQTIATAAISGICVCFYNKETNCWELAFPFDETHKLTISIDENGIPLSDTPIEIELGDKIFIKVKNPTKNHKPFHGNASPNWDDIKIDEKDFGWVFCMDGNHAHSNGVKWKNNAQMIRCSIEGACFYTSEQTSDYYILRKLGEDTAKWLGRMGKKIGVKIFCEEGGEILLQVVSGDSTKFEQIFTQRENVIYGINFDNDCRNLSEARNDFHLYYNIFESNNNDEFELLEIQASDIQLYGARAPCNVIWIDDIDSLFI